MLPAAEQHRGHAALARVAPEGDDHISLAGLAMAHTRWKIVDALANVVLVTSVIERRRSKSPSRSRRGPIIDRHQPVIRAARVGARNSDRAGGGRNGVRVAAHERGRSRRGSRGPLVVARSNRPDSIRVERGGERTKQNCGQKRFIGYAPIQEIRVSAVDVVAPKAPVQFRSCPVGKSALSSSFRVAELNKAVQPIGQFRLQQICRHVDPICAVQSIG